MDKAKILVIVEGERTDVRLMEHLLSVYGINDNHEIVSYKTNIYTLYKQIIDYDDPESVDLLQLLKERERDEGNKKIFDLRYSDILLIFDLDPQDEQYSPDKVEYLTKYFTESTEKGKLYWNYPMVEAFYHMKDIPDEDYCSYRAYLDELEQGKYKSRVNVENRNHDYTKFAVNRDECSIVIRQNIKKAYLIIDETCTYDMMPDDLKILAEQVKTLQTEQYVYVLCTCVFYIADYNPKLLVS